MRGRLCWNEEIIEDCAEGWCTEVRKSPRGSLGEANRNPSSRILSRKLEALQVEEGKEEKENLEYHE